MTATLMNEFLRLINEFRAGQSPHVNYNDTDKNEATPELANLVNNPLPALKMNFDLSAAAYMHSRDLVENRMARDLIHEERKKRGERLSGHEGTNGSGFGARASEAGYGFSNGEIVTGAGSKALDAFLSWYNSNGHRGGMMTQNATEIGVGFFGGKATVKFGNGDTNPDSFVPEDVKNAISEANFSDPIPQVPANQQVGTTNADTMNGDASNNILHGSWGEDTINGNGGNDTLYGGLESDLLNGGAGNDVLEGKNWLPNESDTLTGGEGADTFIIKQGHEQSGLLTITDFTRGVDTLDFGNGNLSYSVATNNGRTDTTVSLNGRATAVIQGIDLTQATINGTPGNDNLTGFDASADTISGFAGDDTIAGLKGNDLLNGDGGNDSLVGNDGNDTLNGGIGNDSLEGNSGNDVLNGNDGDDLLKGGAGSDTINGGAGNDSLQGDGGNDLLNGDAGNDRLTGRAWSSDTINGGAGDDRIDGGSQYNTGDIDILTGGAGADTFVLTQNQFYYAGEGHAVIKDFDPGVDKLEGLWGHSFSRRTENGRTDTLVTKNGDTLAILEGVDLTAVTGTNGNDTLTGTSSSDTISGATGNDSITGKGGHDLLNGDAGNDTLLGNAWSNDTLIGGAGDDLINGAGYTGTGESDVLTGGAGADTFVLDQRWGAYKGDSHATITDFESGVDKIQGLWSASVGISDYNNDGQMDSVLTRNNDVIAVLESVELTQTQLSDSII